MTRTQTAAAVLMAAALALVAGRAAHAASLQQVTGWQVAGLPADVTMWAYVPDNVAANPAANAPVLALIHYCGGTASAVFGQAQGGGIVRAADQYGFIIVAPSSGRCWDVQSNKAWTRDGGGDSHAIKHMVTHAITKYAANAARVYATGDSSGGMMTELLLALYPEIFKAGSAFAGMPAGCRGANESTAAMGYSGACAGGSVMRTAQEWGNTVRMMYPAYTGHRPRVQLFHGDADTIIRYPNHTEAIKEWTNVLGLDTTPTSTATGVTLGSHQATRQSWKNACGYVVLDAFTSLGGDHGPSDALFPSQYVIPFLGLDKVGAVDPEIEQCGSGGGSDGGVDAGGPGGTGGAAGGGGGGRGGAGGGGGRGTGGTGGVGGGGGGAGGGATVGAAGRGGGAGNVSTGGRSGGSGGDGNGGAGGASDGAGVGGRAMGGGPGGGAGAAGTQGAGAAAGTTATGGSAGTGAGGTSNESGAGGNSAGGGGNTTDGCSCALRGSAKNDRADASSLALTLALATLLRRSRGKRRRG
jgi:poly(hydroxyalkanoate) depolymerase family esterase